MPLIVVDDLNAGFRARAALLAHLVRRLEPVLLWHIGYPGTQGDCRPPGAGSTEPADGCPWHLRLPSGPPSRPADAVTVTGLSSGTLAWLTDPAPALPGKCRTVCGTDLFFDPATLCTVGLQREAAARPAAARRATLCPAGDVPRLRGRTRTAVPWVSRELARGRPVLAVHSPPRLYFGRPPSTPPAEIRPTCRIALVRLARRPDWEGLRRAVAAAAPDVLALELTPNAAQSAPGRAAAGWMRRQARSAAARLNGIAGLARAGDGEFVPLSPLPGPPADASPPGPAERVAEPATAWRVPPLPARRPEELGAAGADALVAAVPDAAALRRIVGRLAVGRSTPMSPSRPEETRRAFAPGPGPRLDLPLALQLSRLSPWLYRALAAAVVACRHGRLDGAGRVVAAGGSDGPAAAVLLTVSGRPPLQTLALEQLYLRHRPAGFHLPGHESAI